MIGAQSAVYAVDVNNPRQAEALRELVDRMEDDVAAERRDRGEHGNVEERRNVAPVEPDDQAPD